MHPFGGVTFHDIVTWKVYIQGDTCIDQYRSDLDTRTTVQEQYVRSRCDLGNKCLDKHSILRSQTILNQHLIEAPYMFLPHAGLQGKRGEQFNHVLAFRILPAVRILGSGVNRVILIYVLPLSASFA